MEKTTVHLEILTPDRKLVDTEAKFVSAPGTEGEFGVLPGHAELFSLLRSGEVCYEDHHGKHYVAVSWGYAHVDTSTVALLVENAERAEDINLERAIKDRDKWEQELAGVTQEGVKFFPGYRAKLERAQARVDVASRVARK
ncbi:MAG: ATP synthase F1 subunit epsilon [Nitrospinae bacterium]|nr:ATP synthase F1 subunit epsilon [Nitrospinota bacterium]